MIPVCYICEKNEARSILTSREYTATKPVFCSIECAATYGLLHAHFNHEAYCESCEAWSYDCTCGWFNSFFAECSFDRNKKPKPTDCKYDGYIWLDLPTEKKS